MSDFSVAVQKTVPIRFVGQFETMNIDVHLDSSDKSSILKFKLKSKEMETSEKTTETTGIEKRERISVKDFGGRKSIEM